MAELEKIVNQNRECLEALAESDLRSSKYAQALLSQFEGDTSHSIQQPEKPDRGTNLDSQNEGERSIFAF